MPDRNGHTAILDAHGRPYRFDYDAVEDKKRRKPPRIRLVSEDKHLDVTDRRKLVATARDLPRNFAIAAWLCRMHVANVADFTFQARTGRPDLDTRLEELVGWWSKPKSFDVAGRHSLKRFTRIAEVRRLLDGDFFPLKLSSGRVQGIEGDRVRNPRGLPWVDTQRITHGVLTSKGGAHRGYFLHNRRPAGEGWEFDRFVPARHMMAHGYYDRIDQVRGVSPLAAAINSLQDVYELLTHAVAKAKVCQIFGVHYGHDAADEESPGDVTTTTDDDGNVDKSETTVDLGRGPFLVDGSSEDELKIIESSQPAHETQDFTRLLIMIAMKAVDLPYSWFDQKGASWSSNRAEWVLYDQVSEPKRADNRELLNELLAWRIGLWVLDGVLELPKSVSIDDLRWQWVSRRMPWVDPQKEAMGWQKALEQRLTSRQRIVAMRGEDWWEIADELAAEEEHLGIGSAEPTGDQTKQQAARRFAGLATMKDYRFALPCLAS